MSGLFEKIGIDVGLIVLFLMLLVVILIILVMKLQLQMITNLFLMQKTL